MTSSEREILEKKRQQVREEVVKLLEIVERISSPDFTEPSKELDLRNVRTLLALRSRELVELDEQLA